MTRSSAGASGELVSRLETSAHLDPRTAPMVPVSFALEVTRPVFDLPDELGPWIESVPGRPCYKIVMRGWDRASDRIHAYEVTIDHGRVEVPELILRVSGVEPADAVWLRNIGARDV